MLNALGDRMKFYETEQAGQRLLPLIPAMARIDGRAFSAFTRGLERPYDKRLTDLMLETVKYLVRETSAHTGYTQSDEISLTWYASTTASTIFFDGRVQKMESVLAGMTSAYFIYMLPRFLPAAYAARLPHFDARVWNVPTLEEGANYFLWRERDATKNSISMAAQEYYSHGELLGKTGADKQEMLFQKGVNWNNYPDFFKRGSYIQRRKVQRKVTTEELDCLPPKHHLRFDPNLVVERMECIRVDMPPLGRVANRINAIYSAEEPTLAAE